MFAKFQDQFVLIALICAFLLSRLIFLEWDLPTLDAAAYFVEDELFYSIGGFNLYHYGEIEHKFLPWLKVDISSIESPIGTLSSFIALTFFGNTFYGVRIPAVMAGLVIIICCAWLLKMSSRDNSAALLYPIVIVLCFLLVNFGFVMAGRIFEPTVFRMMGMCVCLSFAVFFTPSIECASGGKSFLLGLLSGIAFVFIYPTNFFLPMAFIVATGLIGWARHGFKTAILYSFICSLGVLAALILYYVYQELVFKQSLVDDIANVFYTYKNRTALVSSSEYSILKRMIVNIFMTQKGNLFRLNTPFFFVFLVSLPLFFRLTFYRREPFDIYLFSIWLLFSLQSLFINDFSVRKLVILLPLVILVSFRVYSYRFELRTWLNINHRYRIWFMRYVDFIISFSLVHVLIIGVFVSWHNVKIDITRSIVIVVIGVIGLALIIKIVSQFFNDKKVSKRLMTMCLTLLFMPEIFADFRYIYWKPTFDRRDTLRAIAPKLEGKKIVGCESYAMRLYNNSMVYINPFRYQTEKYGKKESEYESVIRRLMQEGEIDYAFCRLNETRFSMKSLGFERVEVFDINKDKSRAMGLYRPN